MVMSPVHQVWPKPSCKAQWKGEEDKADRGRGGKTDLAVENGEKWRELVAKSSVVPQRPWRLRDRWERERGSGMLWPNALPPWLFFSGVYHVRLFVLYARTLLQEVTEVRTSSEGISSSPWRLREVALAEGENIPIDEGVAVTSPVSFSFATLFFTSTQYNSSTSSSKHPVFVVFRLTAKRSPCFLQRRANTHESTRKVRKRLRIFSLYF